MGHYHPENILEYEFFGQLYFGSDDNWVFEKTGLSTRRMELSKAQIQDLAKGKYKNRHLLPGDDYSTMAKLAEKAYNVAMSRLDKDFEPEIVLSGSSIPDFDIPANACTISKEICKEVPSFDVNSACSSFVVGLHTASAFIRSGLHNNIALFNVERYSTKLNFQERNSCILFGDGAACTTLTSDTDASGLKLIDTTVSSTPSKFEHVIIPSEGLFYQNGSAVQKFAITRTIESTLKLLERNDLDIKDIDVFVAHQANLRMIQSAAKKLGVRHDALRFNVDKFGNQGGAGAPCVLSMEWDNIKKGDFVLIAVVGSGLTWGAALLQKV